MMLNAKNLLQGVRKATQITAMHIIAMMATPIQTE
jgi:hypothetical protein